MFQGDGCPKKEPGYRRAIKGKCRGVVFSDLLGGN